MTAKELNSIRRHVKTYRPLIHCITNPISINHCANAVLAVGGRPIMAEHPDEVREITATAHALMLNTGNITDSRIKSIALSFEEAVKNSTPSVLDVVGIACSHLRRDFAYNLIKSASPTLIKGNYSEINALGDCGYKGVGVDADSSLNPSYISKVAANLAQKHNTTILASGKTDIITDGRRVIYIKSSAPQLAAITGTGCMLGALCACFLSASGDISSAVTACAVLSICGQLSETALGQGSFTVNLMDRLSTLTDEDMEKYLDLEEYKIESI